MINNANWVLRLSKQLPALPHLILTTILPAIITQLYCHLLALYCTILHLALTSRISLRIWGSLSVSQAGCMENIAQRSHCCSLSDWSTALSGITSFSDCWVFDQLLIELLLKYSAQCCLASACRGLSVACGFKGGWRVWISDLDPVMKSGRVLHGWGRRARSL